MKQRDCTRGGMRGEKVEGGRNQREGEGEAGSRQKEKGIRKKERKKER